MTAVKSRHLFTAVLLGLVCLLLASLTLWAPTYWVSITVLALIFAIFAMSIDLLLGYGGMPSFGHAAFYGAGALVCARVSLAVPSIGLFPLLGVSVGAAAVLAIPLGALALRVRGIYFLMLTLAFGQMLWGYAFQAPHDVLGGSDGLIGVGRPPLDILEAIDQWLWQLAGVSPAAVGVRHFYNLTLLAAVATLGLLAALVRSPFGRTLVGIRESEHRMTALGCPTFRYRLAAFIVAGALAGLAGALSTLFNGFANASSLYWTNSGLVLIAAIVGGVGTLVGPALGAAIIVFLKNFASVYTKRWLLILGAVYIGVILFAPRGVLGALRSGR